MKHLFDDWNKLKDRLKKDMFLFFDYDGTLVPIAKSPDKAVISSETRKLLKNLSKIKDCRLAIVSGRSLSDIKNMVGLKGIIYCGNHGLEIEGPKLKFNIQVSPRINGIIKHVKRILVMRLSGIGGVFIEDKGLTIGVHYRLVNKNNLPELKSVLRGVTRNYIIRGKIRITSGKKIYEIKPPLNWDKGKIVSWFLAKQNHKRKGRKIFPVYIGDDTTDEDVFKAISDKNKGLTVYVGRSNNSRAQFRLRGVSDVSEFMRRIIKLKNGGVNKG